MEAEKVPEVEDAAPAAAVAALVGAPSAEPETEAVAPAAAVAALVAAPSAPAAAVAALAPAAAVAAPAGTKRYYKYWYKLTNKVGIYSKSGETKHQFLSFGAGTSGKNREKLEAIGAACLNKLRDGSLSEDGAEKFCKDKVDAP